MYSNPTVILQRQDSVRLRDWAPSCACHVLATFLPKSRSHKRGFRPGSELLGTIQIMAQIVDGLTCKLLIRGIYRAQMALCSGEYRSLFH